ncbi:FkbM family methyltransferase [Methyloceanibacter marginalis]|uniref:FkbM family methyltransferase n=1 Tax=Methyloceanibacter marginalis TaxID=1774971 RepID=UPI0009F54E37|nr:FkbM family methyltransferase [Methyloceanibacter marginalis]
MSNETLRNPSGNSLQPNFCVFTTLVGNYERLNEQSVAAISSVPFICLTDDAKLQSTSWQVRRVPTLFGVDPIRSQRALKIQPFECLPEFDCSLYIDNSVLLTKAPEKLFEQFDEQTGFGIGQHAFRETVLDEFLAVVHQGKDEQGRVFEQLNHYSLVCPEALEEKPFWTGLMLRDHRNPDIRELMRFWCAHVLRYSRRDQLSLNVVLRSSNLRPQVLPIDTHASQFHSWPHTAGRSESKRATIVRLGQVPSAVGIRTLELQMQEYERALTAEKAKEDAAKIALDRERADHIATRKALSTLEHSVSQLRSSTSWRLTAPLRAVKSRLRTPRRPPLNSLRPAKEAARPRFHVSPSDRRGHELLRRAGDLNPLTLKIWCRLVAEGPWTHIIDVGANYGEMLLGTKLPTSAKVLAFEPNPLIAPYLEWNLAEARIRADVIQTAVSNHVGEAPFLIDYNWSGVSRIGGEDSETKDKNQTITVPTTTISKVLGDDSDVASGIRLLIKVDVEGHEVRALAGMLEMLDSFEDFAALVELLHVSPSDRSWIIKKFDVELLDKKSPLNALVRVVPATPEAFSVALGDGQYYRQDVVLRRKKRIPKAG